MATAEGITIGSLVAEIEAKDVEIERLRAALNGIVGYCSCDELPVNRGTLIPIRHAAEQALRRSNHQ